jgi:hypothetical protein
MAFGQIQHGLEHRLQRRAQEGALASAGRRAGVEQDCAPVEFIFWQITRAIDGPECLLLDVKLRKQLLPGVLWRKMASV